MVQILVSALALTAMLTMGSVRASAQQPPANLPTITFTEIPRTASDRPPALNS